VADALLQQGAALHAKHLKLVDEESRIHSHRRPALATHHATRLDLRTMVLRDHGQPGNGVPTLVYAPHAAAIADDHEGPNLVKTLLANGIQHVALTEWKSAIPDMKDLEITNDLADMVMAINDLGGRVNLVCRCQGDWVSAVLAARLPEKVHTLVLAGALIETNAGNGKIRKMVQASPMAFYEALVTLGGGLMEGKCMLRSWKNMHPEQHCMQDHVDLYEHIDDDDACLAKQDTFGHWYENPIDLPERCSLKVLQELFKRIWPAKGPFVALGRTLNLRHIARPPYLLASEGDGITPPSRCSMRPGWWARHPNRSSKPPFLAGTLASSWARALCPSIGHRSRAESMHKRPGGPSA
jgi:pimeloyl-ACP methyl ester carboxylesterase